MTASVVAEVSARGGSVAEVRERWIRRQLAAAPPMSPEQRHRIAAVLFGQSKLRECA